MIQRLRIRGFRSLEDVTWEPGKLNVIIGPNGSGKSNLLRALGLLRCSAAGDLPAQVLRQGGLGALLWDGQAPELAWELEAAPPHAEDAWGFSYDLRLLPLGEGGAYRIQYETLTASNPRTGELFDYLMRRPGHAVIYDQQHGQIQAHEASVPDEQTLLALLAGPFGHPRLLGCRERLMSWGIYHDLQTHEGAPIRQAQVARLATRLAPHGEDLVPVLHTLYSTRREFKNDVDQALRAAFGDDFEGLVFPPAADQRVQLRLHWRTLRNSQSAADLSDGTLRFLLLLAILANPDPGALIAIDEPETGLHPSMFPVVAELARQAAEHTQVILTTHSPQFLDAFGAEPPATTVATWSDGKTKLALVDGEELRRWLHEYTLGALFRSGELENLA